MSRAVLGLGLALAALFVAACENRQAFETPDPSLARMLEQRRADPYESSMRAPPHDTVARDDDSDDPEPPITRGLLDVGRARYDRVCAPCHGVDGQARTFVASKMELRKPPSLHEPRVRALGRDRLVTVIAEGYGLMPAYAAMLPRKERVAVAAYVEALQLSRHARVADLPPAVQHDLEKAAP